MITVFFMPLTDSRSAHVTRRKQNGTWKKELEVNTLFSYSHKHTNNFIVLVCSILYSYFTNIDFFIVYSLLSSGYIK